MKKFNLTTIFIGVFATFGSAQNLVVDYDFNGDFNDNSINANHAIEFGGTSSDFLVFDTGSTAFNSDSSVYFDNLMGLESSLPIDNSSWNAISVSFWIKNAADGNIYQCAYCGNSVFADVNGGLEIVFDGSSAGALGSTINLNDNQWHHIVAQNNGTVTSLFIDGTLDASQNETLYLMSGANSLAKIYLGLTNGALNKLEGNIDRFKMYDDILTLTQIEDLYMAGLTSAGINAENAWNVITYPNPTSNFLNFSEVIDQVQVYDLYGKLVLQNIGSISQIDLSVLEKGAYLIHLQNEKGTSIQKIIKE